MRALPAGLFAALVLTTAASALPPVPPYVGTWTRTLSAQDIARLHTTRLKAGMTWTLVITEQKATVSSPGIARFVGVVVPSSKTQFTFEIGKDTSNLYSWSRVGKTLILRKYSEPNAERAAILSGVWKRG